MCNNCGLEITLFSGVGWKNMLLTLDITPFPLPIRENLLTVGAFEWMFSNDTLLFFVRYLPNLLERSVLPAEIAVDFGGSPPSDSRPHPSIPDSITVELG